jgi:DNA-binding PadR family transcriptional regulator
MTLLVRGAGATFGGSPPIESAPRRRLGAGVLGSSHRHANGREQSAVVLKHATLAILAEEPSHGYAILARLEKRIGDLCGIGHGQIYRMLTALERNGLIVGRAEQVARRPTRRVYTVSDAGREAVQRWLMEAPAHTTFFGADVYVRLPFLSVLERERREEVLGRHVSRCREHLATLVSQRQRSRPTDIEGVLRQLVLEAAIRHSEADLEMLERCRAELGSTTSSIGGTGDQAGGGAQSGAKQPTR